MWCFGRVCRKVSGVLSVLATGLEEVQAPGPTGLRRDKRLDSKPFIRWSSWAALKLKPSPRPPKFRV